jgi:hypothetical protein
MTSTPSTPVIDAVALAREPMTASCQYGEPYSRSRPTAIAAYLHRELLWSGQGWLRTFDFDNSMSASAATSHSRDIAISDRSTTRTGRST